MAKTSMYEVTLYIIVETLKSEYDYKTDIDY